MNAIFNAWNPYQTVNTFLTPRGYRDSSQDVLGIVHMLPAEVRKRLLVLLSHEFQNGATTHDYSPDPQFSVLKDGVMRDGDVRFGAKAGTTLEEQFGSRGSDPPLWVAPAVNAYVKETGDFSLLKRRSPSSTAAPPECSITCSEFSIARGVAAGCTASRCCGRWTGTTASSFPLAR